MSDHGTSYSYAPSPAISVALLEDNWELRQEILLPALRDFGFHVQGVGTATELYRAMLTHRFDIVVLDIGLPDEDGLTVAQHLRAISNIGIVILTGRDGRQHQLNAFKHGADVYLTKPVDLDLLAASLHSLTRRIMHPNVHNATADSAELPPWRLEAGGWQLISPLGKTVALTLIEQCLVMALAASNGQPMSRESLIRTIARDDYHFDPHRLEMMIHRLRRKVQTQTGETLPLLTVRGSGYRLTIESQLSIPSSL